MITSNKPTGAPSAANLCCPRCSTQFQPRRKNQMYCGRDCAKAATRNSKRSPRTIKDNPSAKRTHENRAGRCKSLSLYLYETPPEYRAEYLEKLIAEGRKVKELRDLVTRRHLLESWLRGKNTGHLHIAHVLDHYCQEVYGMRSYEVLNNATVLPPQADLAFPAEYFGPDMPPFYGDGILRRRPCPWRNWELSPQANRPSTLIKGKLNKAA